MGLVERGVAFLAGNLAVFELGDTQESQWHQHHPLSNLLYPQHMAPLARR